MSQNNDPSRTAGNDAGTPAGNDAGTPAGNDAGTPAGNDAGTPAGNDAGTPAGTPAGMDAGMDAGMPGMPVNPQPQNLVQQFDNYLQTVSPHLGNLTETQIDTALDTFKDLWNGENGETQGTMNTLLTETAEELKKQDFSEGLNLNKLVQIAQTIATNLFQNSSFDPGTVNVALLSPLFQNNPALLGTIGNYLADPNNVQYLTSLFNHPEMATVLQSHTTGSIPYNGTTNVVDTANVADASRPPYVRVDDPTYECPVCINVATSGVAVLACGHRLCIDCARNLTMASTTSPGQSPTIECPFCSTTLQDAILYI